MQLEIILWQLLGEPRQTQLLKFSQRCCHRPFLAHSRFHRLELTSLGTHWQAINYYSDLVSDIVVKLLFDSLSMILKFLV